MTKRKQQELELQAAVHGIPVEKRETPSPVEPSTSNLKKELAERIAKGLPVKVMIRKK
ncbi:unnamed protein product [marine sediment metagenome]|uniref:Uncharacterized protein n=1 Tax=marine sediment metagenome TaxID=412755 RepID=X1A064_9ZZZZ